LIIWILVVAYFLGHPVDYAHVHIMYMFITMLQYIHLDNFGPRMFAVCYVLIC